MLFCALLLSVWAQEHLNRNAQQGMQGQVPYFKVSDCLWIDADVPANKLHCSQMEAKEKLAELLNWLIGSGRTYHSA